MLINILVFVLTFLEVLTALLLIGIILVQQSKAGGGLGAVGGGVTETVFGATAGNVLTRGTVILASVFLAVTLLLAVITGHRRVGRSIADELRPAKAVEMPPPKTGTKTGLPKQKTAGTAKQSTAPTTVKAGTANGSTPAKAGSLSPKTGTENAKKASGAAK